MSDKYLTRAEVKISHRPLVLVTNSTAEYVKKFRIDLLKSLSKEGVCVGVVSPIDGAEIFLVDCGFFHQKISLKGAGNDPVKEIISIHELCRCYRLLGPNLVLHFTPKVDIYGGFAARVMGIPCINNLSGMGTALTRGGALGFGVKQLLRVTQRSAAHLFVQNPDDADYVLEAGIGKPERVSVLPGSGINLAEFPVEPMPSAGGAVHFALIARLVPEKGVLEFMAAARALRKAGVPARFSIAGDIPPGFSKDLDRNAVAAWSEEPGQRWLGKIDSVKSLIASADCVVLPSYYREGTPHVLLEAAAMGRPIIAADSIGTREPLIPGETGLMCQPRDVEDLVSAMRQMINRGAEQRQTMGLAGRRLMERKYDVRFVVDAYMQKIHEVLG